MVCRACGRIIANEKANFCEYCGTSVDGREEGYSGGSQSYSNNQSYDKGQKYGSGDGYNNQGYSRGDGFHYENPNYNGSNSSAQSIQGGTGLIDILGGTAGTAEAEPSMSFVHWIVILLLPYIPMIGSFAYIVLLLVWAFGKTATTTRKNWARASLLLLLIGMILMVAMMPSLFAMLSEGDVSGVLDSLLGANPAR